MKILDMFAHEGYHYELCKLKCQFTIVTDQGHRWNSRYRPAPSNAAFLDKGHLVPKVVESYDVVIVHNYKQLQLFRECNIPKILVMHCSKKGQGDAELAVEDLSEYVVVFNSYKDRQKW